MSYQGGYYPGYWFILFCLKLTDLHAVVIMSGYNMVSF